MAYNQKIAYQRSFLTQKIRDFFTNNHFLEVETPIMTPIPGMEPYLTPFETTFNTPQNKSQKLFLNTSPELQMKKLLGAGFKNIFQLIKVFRNGEIGGELHNPEFTMLEWYRSNATYLKLMADCENLILNLVQKDAIIYQNQKISLKKPWLRFSTNELFIKYCKIDLNKNKTLKEFQRTASLKKLDINGCNTWDDIYFKIFLNHIEPFLPKERPIFIFDYPSSQAALSKKKKSNPFFAERFELYISGIELANAFSELIDSKEQRERLLEEQKLREKLKKTVFDIDEEFLTGLESITSKCAGIALGIDRLMMLLLNQKNIENVLLFPLNQMLKFKNKHL